MNVKKAVFPLALLLMLAASCKSQYEILLNSTDMEAKYAAAFDYFNDGKYNKAGDLFESLAQFTNGTERDDTVRFYWGLSNYNFKDYYTAETNFDSFLSSFPRSPFAPEATFLRVDCLYRQTLRYELDQTPTYKAITEISKYIMDYPKSAHFLSCQDMLDDLNERLDRKAFEGAKLYYRMEDYQAARVALRNVLKDDSENRYREDILYYTAMASYKFAYFSVPEKQKERYLTFTDDYFNFIGELPESSYRKELDALYKRSQKALGKYSGDDDDDKMKEKDYAKERKESEKKASPKKEKEKNETHLKQREYTKRI